MPTLPFLLPAGDIPVAAPAAPVEASDLVALAASQPALRLAQRDDSVGVTAPTPRIAGLGAQGASSTQAASPRLNVGPNRYT